MIESLAPGGAERAIVDLTGALSQDGHTCAVVSICPCLQLASELHERGVGVYSLELADPRALVHAAVRLRSVVDRFRPDVIHAHLFFAELACAGATVANGSLPARVVTFHNLGYDSYPVDSLWRRFRRGLERAAIAGFELQLAGGEAIAAHYAHHLRLPSVTPVPYACTFLDPPALSGQERELRLTAMGIDPNAPLLTLPGSFRPEKGHRYLLQALANLHGAGLAVQAAFTSAGPLRDEIQSQARALGIDRSVHFLGVLPTKLDVITLMTMSDLVVLPSTHEGYPISAIEAMGAGAAVVASAVGGLKELINDGVTGCLVEPRDPSQLAAAVAELLSDPARRETIGRAAAVAVRDFHRPEVVAARHEALYRKAISRRLRRTRSPLPLARRA